MAKFYRDGNNGVIAIVSEETMEQIKRLNALAADIGWMQTHALNPEPIRPIFTFVHPENYTSERAKFVTGSYEHMDLLLKGHTVQGGSFYVPFSNSYEYSDSTSSGELLYRTTLPEALKVFGLTRAQEALV